jgi:aryl-alcohol dehydrogenase-like predicted oxidoreductase
LAIIASSRGQYQYSLVKRDIEAEYIDLFENEGLGLLPWGPLGGGFLTGKYTRNEKPQEGRISHTADHTEESWERRNNERNWNTLELLEQYAKEKDASVSQLALAWLFYQKTVCSVIVGPRTLEQFDDNMGALNVHFSEEELQALAAASRPDERYPYRMLDAYASRKL